MHVDVVAVGADWVTLLAVRAQLVGVACVQACEGVSAAAVLLESGALREDLVDTDVVWLVGLVHDIAEDESSSNGTTRSSGTVQTGSDLGTSTRSSKDISSDPGTLGEAVEDDVRARALLVELRDLEHAVLHTRLNLGAEVAVLHRSEYNIDVVAGLANSLKLVARSRNEREDTAVVVRRIVTAGLDDNDIGADSGDLGVGAERVFLGQLVQGLGGSGGREGAERESVADERRHY